MRPASFAMAIGLAAVATGFLPAGGTSPMAHPLKVPRAGSFIVGGGEQPEQLLRRFVELAGGPGRAQIAVTPLASEEAHRIGCRPR